MAENTTNIIKTETEVIERVPKVIFVPEDTEVVSVTAIRRIN